MKKLYYVRHGLSTGNEASIVSGGKSDHPLAQEGKRQAKLAGQKAKDLNIDLIVSSTQTRAFQTAKIISKEIGYPVDEIQVNSILVERDYGDYEGHEGTLSPEILNEIYNKGIGGSESNKDLRARAEEAFKWISSLKADNILVVSHGSFGRVFRQICISEYDFEEKIPNAEIVCWIE